jgi:hypothetical protein
MALHPDSQKPSGGEILLYQTPSGDVQVECLLQDETIWLSLNRIAELFDVDQSGISRHLKNIFETGELARDSVVAIFASTAADGNGGF